MSELQQDVLLSLGLPALGDVGLGGIHGDRPAVGAGGGVIGLLDEVPFLVELLELPLDELPVVGVQGAGEPPPVGEEPEPLPVLGDVDIVEELHDGHGVFQLLQLLLGASVPQEVVDGLLVAAGDLVRQADASVPGSVGSHGEEDVVAGHALVPADRIDIGVSAEMPDMKVPCDPGVRKDNHELGLAVDPLGLVQVGLLPPGLPFCFHGAAVVCHEIPFSIRARINKVVIYILKKKHPDQISRRILPGSPMRSLTESMGPDPWHPIGMTLYYANYSAVHLSYMLSDSMVFVSKTHHNGQDACGDPPRNRLKLHCLLKIIIFR